jgi:hypothetical protein
VKHTTEVLIDLACGKADISEEYKQCKNDHNELFCEWMYMAQTFYEQMIAYKKPSEARLVKRWSMLLRVTRTHPKRGIPLFEYHSGMSTLFPSSVGRSANIIFRKLHAGHDPYSENTRK